MTTFKDLKISPWLIEQLKSVGIKEPTPIQENCIPAIMAGKDVIGAAKTGSGKTLAFALPIVQKLSEDPYGIFALILTPTRELAFQISDQFAVIGKSINLRKCTVVGGLDMMYQGQELSRRPHIVVATPGRLADHLQSCDTFSLQRIKFLVLDEADRLLGGNYDAQMSIIFKAIPKERQSLLFSATITDALDKVKQVSSKEVFMWESTDDSGLATVKELDQRYVLCPYNVRDAYLVEVIRTFRYDNATGSIMIFTDTCKNCQLISMTMNEVGFENVALHAMIKQKDRLTSLQKFKSKQVKILIATDVAARGLDIPIVSLVINHNIPNIPKEYIHRVGRTARAGRNGMAISLVTPQDIKLLHAIEELVGTKLTNYEVSDKEIVQIFTEVSATKREAEAQLDQTDFDEKKMINKRKKLIEDGLDPEEADEILSKKKKQNKEKKDSKKDEAEMELDETDVNEKKMINKRKKSIAEKKVSKKMIKKVEKNKSKTKK
ncbi:probable ATP-dependent RNA helicase DDX49 [Trichogramma pretiosum]|uniref:probable ATP-dependent RNA helicase DDX49 n=1 Tax=Trichogramma pretiosum TaxID=7493 RepID=UPI0006C9749F|nr:probable ATP-dependent RNA helicase DDX49 [Trichogramma pretiosum]